MDDTHQDSDGHGRMRPDDGLPPEKTQADRKLASQPAAGGEIRSPGLSDDRRPHPSRSTMKLLALILLLLLNAFMVNEFKKQAPPANPAATGTAAEPRSAPHPRAST